MQNRSSVQPKTEPQAPVNRFEYKEKFDWKYEILSTSIHVKLSVLFAVKDVKVELLPFLRSIVVRGELPEQFKLTSWELFDKSKDWILLPLQVKFCKVTKSSTPVRSDICEKSMFNEVVKNIEAVGTLSLIILSPIPFASKKDSKLSSGTYVFWAYIPMLKKTTLINITIFFILKFSYWL